MALKFLNKKGWHTGSLRNIENVWKAEQKQQAEQRKVEELRKQIQDERERAEYRQLQEQAGLVPRQERLDFLYDSGLAVGKGSSSNSVGVAFKPVEEGNKAASATSAAADSGQQQQQQQAAVPGALFEDKPHSANDAWRKLHSDPLLMIRQREQEALAQIKNNPIKMAQIRKSVEENKEKDKGHDKKKHQKKHRHSKHRKHSSPEEQSDTENERDKEGRRRKKSSGRRSKYDERYHKVRGGSDDEPSERESQRRKSSYSSSKYREQSPSHLRESRIGKDDGRDARRKHHDNSKSVKHSMDDQRDLDAERKERETKRYHEARPYESSATEFRSDSRYKRQKAVPKLSEEERAAKLQEMQMDAELHEEQRWKRLKKAEEQDAGEATCEKISGSRNFLDAAHRSVYGAEKGGSSTIEESVRRRTHYLQGGSEASERNAFRR